MKHSVFRWLQTLLLITSLAANLVPATGLAIASEPRHIDDTDSLSVPSRSGPESPARGLRDCAVGYLVAMYRPDDAPDPSVPAETPVNRTGNSPLDQVPPDDYIEVPGTALDPDHPASAWQVPHPGNPPLNSEPTVPPSPGNPPLHEFRTRHAVPVPLNDVRRDESTNFSLIRGEQIKLMIWMRNNTVLGSCPGGQENVYVRGMAWEVLDRNGVVGSGSFGPGAGQQPITDFVVGETSSPLPANGLIPPMPIAANASASDSYVLIDFTVPNTADGYLNFRVKDLEYCVDSIVGSNCTGANPSYQTSVEPDNYVDIVGGPLATATLDIIGPETGRRAGDFAWFVVEVTSLAGTVDQQDPTISTITDVANSLPECRNTSSPPLSQGWYQSDFTPPFATLDSAVIDPLTFTPGGTRFNYTSGTGMEVAIDDMNVLETERVYCAFRRQLLPDSNGNFVIDADLLVTGYPPYPGGTPLTLTLNVSKTITVGTSALRVDKTIVGPLVQPPEIDPNTGQPRVKSVVNTGETITYEITVTNIGDVPIDTVSLNDSLIGPFSFPPANVLNPEDSPGVCNNAPCSATITLTYTVQFSDPSPIQNVVEARAEIVGTAFALTAQDVASILKAESELQLVLTTATPPGDDGFQPGEVITYQLQYCNTGTANLTSIEFLGGYPTRYDAGNAAGTLLYAQPAYPIVRQYLDNPPVVASFSAPPFLAGTCGTINFNYTIPAVTDPTFRDPIFQDIRMRATRTDGTSIFGQANLVTPLTNNNVNIEATLFDPSTGAARTDTTVLRGENLMFDLVVTNLSETQRCNARVNLYRLNTITGAETLISSDLLMNWPSFGNHQLDRASLTPDNIADTLPGPGDPRDMYRPQYLVDGATPDPLVLIFEIDARENCAGGAPQPEFIARQALVLDVTDVQIATTLEIRNRTTNTRVSTGFYPLTADVDLYKIFFSATNVGPATMTINSWSYCILSSPINGENCTSQVNEVNMFDGSDSQGNSGGTYPDFGVDQTFSQGTRQFTTLQTRVDQRAFNLQFGQTYPNPLVIQVIIRGTDNKGSNVVIRDSIILPLITGDLNLSLSGPATLVRGDANVPIAFGFSNPVTGGTLQNVQVLNLMEEDATNGVEMPPGLGFDNTRYELCTYQGGGTSLATMLASEAASGVCLFDFTENVPTEGNILRFRAAVIATEQTTAQNVVDIRFVEIEVIPHLVMIKAAPELAVKSDTIPYSIVITNQSAYQYVDFPPDSFTDVFSPAPDGTICTSPGGAPCPPTIANFSPLTPAAGNYRIAPSSSATVSYTLAPPIASGQHGADGYSNTATVTGNRQFDTAEVSATDSHRLSLACPLQGALFYDLAHAETTSTDAIFTLGESVNVTVQWVNFGSQDLTFTSWQDLRVELDEGTVITLNDITWPTATVGLLPANGGMLSYNFTLNIRPTDFLQLVGESFAPATPNNGTRGGPVTGDIPLTWRIYYQTNLSDPPNSDPCFDSDPAHFWYSIVDIFNPVRIDKTADRSLAFTGQAVNYSVSIFNISEVVDVLVEGVDDSLFGGNIAMAYPGGTGISGLLPLDDPFTLPVIVNSQGPLTRSILNTDPERLVNTAVVNYRAQGGPGWMTNPPEVGVLMSNSDSAEVATSNPLQITKQVLVPTTGIAARGGQVEYLISLVNNSTFTITDISLTDSRMTIPTCTPPGSGQPRCLDNPTNFSMAPGTAIQVILTYTIPVDEAGPSVTNTATATGELIIDGISTALPPVTASATVSLTAPALTITPGIYADAACTQLLVDVQLPVDRDRNNDGIPEATVTELIYYRFDLFAGGGKTFENVQLVANLQNGDASLTNNLQAAFEAHPNAQPPGILSDNVSAAPEMPEVTLCIPYVIQDRLPDPLELIASISGNEENNGTESRFEAAPLPLDVGDPNIFISKTTDRIVAFPGQEVTYTLLIENRSQFLLEINDVYDDRLGGQLFFDHDLDPLTPPVTGDYQRDPLQTSINFNTPIFAVDGTGWTWPGAVGLLQPGESVSYVYRKTILNTDADPLLNRAGVLATVKRPPADGGDVDASDETLNSLAITNSQLRVTKNVVPTTTLLGNIVTYTVSVLNIGDTPVYDIVLTDDRYDLEYGVTPNSTQLVDNGPGVLVMAGGATCNGFGTNNDLGPAGATAPCSGDPIVVVYTLPTQPACVRWNGGVCDAYDDPASDLPFIDPFINTATASGQIEDPNNPGSLIDIMPPGNDSAIVDLINPGIRIEKTTAVGGAAIGTDVEYTVRIVNTGDVYIRVDEVIDVPDSNLPIGNTITTELPIDRLFYEDCPVPTGVTTNPSGATNLQGSILRPFSEGGNGSSPANSPIAIDNTAILLPGCAAVATVTVQVPTTTNNEYVNVVQVNGVDGDGNQVTDLSSAIIDIRSAGIEIAKRAWNCDTAPNGINQPPVIGGNQQCTINSGLATAQNLIAQDEGRFVFYELTLVNSGSDAFDQLSIRDEQMIVTGGVSNPSATITVPNGTSYTAWNWLTNSPQAPAFTWLNGVLTLRDTTPGVTGDGPFGPDDPATIDVDESNWFEPGESFARPDPGPVDIPVITYRHTVTLPVDTSETIPNPSGPARINYINRATVTGTSSQAGITPITNTSEYILEVRPAQLGMQLQACVEANETGAPPFANFDPDVSDPCVDVAQVEDALGNPQPAYVWYRLTLTNNSDTISMQNITVTDTVRGNIPSSDACWDSDPGGSWLSQGILPPNATVICTYLRDDTFAPLTTSDDPYTNTAVANFTLGGGAQGNPSTASATIRITRGALLLSLVGCETIVRAPGGTTLNFNLIVENINPTTPISNLEIYVPDPATGQPTQIPAPPAPTSLTGGQQVTLTNALQVVVPVLGPTTNDYLVSAFGNFAGNQLTATATCTVQRADSNLVVTKTVINPVTGNATAQPGDVVNYTITVENLGGIDITGLQVTDPRLPAPALAWPTTLPAGQTVSRTISYTVPAGEDPIVNRVTVEGTAGITLLTAQAEAQLAIADGDIVVSATANPNPVFAGSSTTFNYEVCNLSTTINYTISDFSETIVGLVNPVTTNMTDAQGNPVPATFTLNALQCRQFVHTVPTVPEDAGATVRGTLYAEGQDATCAPGCATTVSDSQNVEVMVIDPNAEVVVEITANKPTVTNPDNIQFTVTVTNISGGTVTLTAITDELGLFTGHPSFVGRNLNSFASASATLPYAFNGTPDPLYDQVTVDYTVLSSGLTGIATDDISIPVVAVAGAEVIVQIIAPSVSTPGADLIYRYDVTNVGGSTVTDAYIDNRTITPPPACATTTPNDWAVGGAANLIPPMPIGMTRSATVICRVDPAFPVTPPGGPASFLTHTVEVHRTGAAPTLQDNDTRNVEIIPPLELTMEQVNLAVPGGYAYIRYSVRNIGTTTVNDVSLSFNTPDLPSCDSTQTSDPSTWIANPFGTDTGLNLLPTSATTQSIAVGETLIATLGCFVPITFLDGPPALLNRTFAHNGQVNLSGVLMDDGVVNVSVIQPIEVTFLPQNNPASVTTPTTPGVAPTFLRAEDSTQLVVRLRNIGPPGFSATGVTYSLTFTNQNGSSEGTLFCEQQTIVTSWGGAFTGTLANPGDYIDVVCNYRPQRLDAGLVKVLDIGATHEVNGTTVNIPVVNPVMTATVEYLSMTVTLTGVPNSQGQGESRVDDGEIVQYTLLVQNNGSVPISTFQFTQNMLDLDTGQPVPGNENFLTPGSPLHTLTDLWNVNTNASGARCPDPLGPGQTCVISGSVPLHLIMATDMNHVVVPADPNRYEVRVLGQARSTTASGFTITGTGAWRTVVQRPILRIGGPNASVNKDQNGLVWVYVPTYLTWTPNPAELNSEITFTVQIENAGFKNIFTPSLAGQINLLPTAAVGMAHQTPPTNLTFDISAPSIRRGEIISASATWSVEGVTPPTNVYLRLNFQGDVEGNYPDYNFVTPPMPVPIVADPNAVPGLVLDPNATEPIVTKTASVESAQPGEPVTWTITVTNGSTAIMPNVVVTDAIPGDLEVISAATSAGASILTGNLLDVTLGDLDAGEQATITISTNIALTASVPGIITNTAVAQRDGGTPVSAEASVGVGTTSDANPATGIGLTDSTGSLMQATGMAKYLPFLLGILSVFFVMMMSNRQRLILVVLAVVVVVLLAGGLLLITSGEDEEAPPNDGTPVDEASIFATATPLPTEVAEVVAPTAQPTVAAEALATIQSFPPTATPYILPTQAGPRRLDIPALNYSIPIPIVELPLINKEWDVSNLGHNIGWLDQTTWFDPGWGNTVLVGHIQLSNAEPGPFEKLDSLEPGDEVLVYEGDLVRKFTVTEIFTVGAAETQATHPTTNPVLTLMTCTNWNDSRGIFSDRLVVRAVPSDEISDEPTPSSDS